MRGAQDRAIGPVEEGGRPGGWAGGITGDDWLLVERIDDAHRVAISECGDAIAAANHLLTLVT